MSPIERKNALALFPYFSKEPVVFDVGSNKGAWADVLVHNVAGMHLFEPNQKLLTYTEVKYDSLGNIHYCNVAMCEQNGKTVDFYFFTNENNELSSIFNHEGFKNLPVQKTKVNTWTVDGYCKEMKVNHIDFLKIDAEGADYLVLIGSEKMLKKRAIKFIQIENGHVDLEKVISFMNKHGYSPMKNEDNENTIFAQADFTQNWNQEFIRNTKDIPKFNFALEIGCFEGLTTRYICDNMLNPGGRIICVDPLDDVYLPGKETEHDEMFKGQYDRFIRNTRTYPVELIRKKSQDVFTEQFNQYRFDFIYIDGDHSAEAVYQDGKNAFMVLREGGHMLFDDYTWSKETNLGIDRFLDEHAGTYDVIHKDYQILIRKKC